eukprot:GHVR01179241.1.p1 GENE.GHVR01179241.1~~GHVR01179241.1.p1  ORF type:complete len:214 (+),score=119.35 GHVR01179241.1:32-673(+)
MISQIKKIYTHTHTHTHTQIAQIGVCGNDSVGVCGGVCGGVCSVCVYTPPVLRTVSGATVSLYRVVESVDESFSLSSGSVSPFCLLHNQDLEQLHRAVVYTQHILSRLQLFQTSLIMGKTAHWIELAMIHQKRTHTHTHTHTSRHTHTRKDADRGGGRVVCVVCGGGVRGLVLGCYICRHYGHPSHIRAAWEERGFMCPVAGCVCVCSPWTTY